MENIREKIAYSFLFFLLLAVDQWTKAFMSAKMPERVFKNSNFAFSLPIPEVSMYIIYAILLTALLVWFAQKRPKTAFTKTGFVFVISGAVSNIAERILKGSVVDFVHIHTGVLNLADLFIIGGIILLLLDR